MLEDHDVRPDRSLLRPGLRVVITGTLGRGHRPAQYYAGPGNRFYELLQGSGLVDERLDPGHAGRLPDLGVGLTDLVIERVERAGREPETLIHQRPFDLAIRAVAPTVVAFVSKTAATWYARGAGERLPRDYGELTWSVAGTPAFVLPGPSGANNGMSLALRLALWTDLADFVEHVEHGRAVG
ncbi:mismatch-specific DNA-glycosylase [Microlunatus antarcticus]|uniref:TDG/mug DNA glycosylase family protein n=1 Tax=Microlunatus antarcticus TaxID=53388 RepID=A0A7W5P5U4_9ACTN|nr:mismatch-specific DNA-glycosylase [Microlunatus antarcticus]MBB3325161.1 TDG/mug DNA glycosylase family protein [Microlunatus antarcticus]